MHALYSLDLVLTQKRILCRLIQIITNMFIPVELALLNFVYSKYLGMPLRESRRREFPIALHVDLLSIFAVQGH